MELCRANVSCLPAPHRPDPPPRSPASPACLVWAVGVCECLMVLSPARQGHPSFLCVCFISPRDNTLTAGGTNYASSLFFYFIYFLVLASYLSNVFIVAGVGWVQGKRPLRKQCCQSGLCGLSSGLKHRFPDSWFCFCWTWSSTGLSGFHKIFLTRSQEPPRCRNSQVGLQAIS